MLHLPEGTRVRPASVGDAIWLTLRRMRGIESDTPMCRGCGYTATGAPTTTCPECGADWRRVGVVLPRAIKLWPLLIQEVAWAVVFVAAWTALSITLLQWSKWGDTPFATATLTSRTLGDRWRLVLETRGEPAIWPWTKMDDQAVAELKFTLWPSDGQFSRGEVKISGADQARFSTADMTATQLASPPETSPLPAPAGSLYGNPYGDPYAETGSPADQVAKEYNYRFDGWLAVPDERAMAQWFAAIAPTSDSFTAPAVAAVRATRSALHQPISRLDTAFASSPDFDVVSVRRHRTIATIEESLEARGLFVIGVLLWAVGACLIAHRIDRLALAESLALMNAAVSSPHAASHSIVESVAR